MIWLHRYVTLVAAATILLITAGGLVTSTSSGLSVPDWPTTYGWSMFAFPLSKMVGGIRFEHGHRLIASAVGFLTIVLAAWLWWTDDRRWVRYLGLVAVAAVLAQGILGGITVLYFLPAPISILHAGLAPIFFCLTVSLALFTSAGWRAGGATAPDDRWLRLMAMATTGVIYAQILLGAAMRHTGAGLAIPDFPLAFGRLVPPQWSQAIAIHFAHRVGALVGVAMVLATAGRVWVYHRSRRELTRPAFALAILVVVQVTLGALTVLTGKAVAINTAHVVTGAVTLGTSLLLTLRTYRVRFAAVPLRAAHPAAEPAFAPRSSSAGARA